MKRRILSGREFDPDKDEPTDDVEGFWKPEQTHRVNYDDGFSVSYSDVGIADPSYLETPQSRMVLYNDHLVDSLEGIMNDAAELGCPRFQLLIPLSWLGVPDEAFRPCMQLVGQLAGEHEEGSIEWLTLNCFMHAVRASHMATNGTPTPMLAECMMQLGAALREIELSKRNKKDAIARRKQKRSLNANNEGRDAHNNKRREHANAWQELALRLAGEATSSGNARARWISGQLLSRYGIDRKPKTVANFLGRQK